MSTDPSNTNSDKPRGRVKAIISSEVITTGGGIIGLITLILLIYQNRLMVNQTSEMNKTNAEMIVQRKLQQKQRFNHLIEILYSFKDEKVPVKTNYKRLIKDPSYISKLRTEAFHEMIDYLKQENRSLDFSGGALCQGVDFRQGLFEELNFEGAEFSKAILKKGSFLKSNFAKSDFFSADLSQADFSWSKFDEAILFRTDLAGTKLHGVSFKGTVFREVNMTQTDLTQSDLSGAYLKDSNLKDVILNQAIYDSQTVWPENFDLEGAHKTFSLIKAKK